LIHASPLINAIENNNKLNSSEIQSRASFCQNIFGIDGKIYYLKII
jgi:hypothetical protein